MKITRSVCTLIFLIKKYSNQISKDSGKLLKMYARRGVIEKMFLKFLVKYFELSFHKCRNVKRYWNKNKLLNKTNVSLKFK